MGSWVWTHSASTWSNGALVVVTFLVVSTVSVNVNPHWGVGNGEACLRETFWKGKTTSAFHREAVSRRESRTIVRGLREEAARK